MTKYESIVYFSPDEAGEWIHILSSEGIGDLMDKLAGDGYLDFDPIIRDEEPWDPDDWVYPYESYVVTVNYRRGYMSVTRIVEGN